MTFEEWWKHKNKWIRTATTVDIAKAAWQAAQSQLKPSWDDAPEGAICLAQNEDGEWKWYRTKPTREVCYWHVNDFNEEEPAFWVNPNWRETLEERPK